MLLIPPEPMKTVYGAAACGGPRKSDRPFGVSPTAITSNLSETLLFNQVVGGIVFLKNGLK